MSPVHLFTCSPALTVTGVIAQGDDKSGRLFADLLPWLLVLLAAIVIGGLALMWIRGRLQDQASSPTVGFTLHDLRTLHEAGELSDEEFERAKTLMIGQLRSPKAESEGPDREPPPKSEDVQTPPS